MWKLTTLIVIAAAPGTCTNTPQVRPASSAPVQKQASPDDDGSYAGLPEECRELMEECSECDEMERMRRQILAKQCVPVCDAYLDHAAEIDARVPAEGVELLKTQTLCGKEETKCSPLEESHCAHAVDYVLAGQTFRDFWAEPGAAPPADELISRFHAGFLEEYLDAHAATIEWAARNGVEPTPVLVAGGRLMDLVSSDALDGYHAELAPGPGDDADLSRRYEASGALLELVRQPGDVATWTQRRADLEAEIGPSK